MAGAAFAIAFEGLSEAVERYRAFSDSSDLVKEAGRTLFARASRILAVSKRLVPVDSGVLKASGFASIPVSTPASTSVEIAYGGAAAPYAFIVHEDLHVHHKVGQAKYLEVPFNAERGGVLGDLRDLVREMLAAKKGFRRLTSEVAAEQAAAGAIGHAAFRAGRGFRAAEAIGKGLAGIGQGLRK